MRGYPGTNIQCDVFMEHVNRRLKTMIRGVRVNVSPTAIQKAGKAIPSVHHIHQQFELQKCTSLHSDYHSLLVSVKIL